MVVCYFALANLVALANSCSCCGRLVDVSFPPACCHDTERLHGKAAQIRGIMKGVRIYPVLATGRTLSHLFERQLPCMYMY